MQSLKSFVPMLISIVVTCLPVACSGGSASNGAEGAIGGQSGVGGSGSGNVGGGTTSTAASTATCTSSCDDGIGCTVDACVNGTCQHSIGPRTGATACPTGQYCTVESGCVAAPACSTADQCVTAWKGDACKTKITCEAASSVCMFELLDKDGDGHAPQICGGDDCNDSAGGVYPGALDGCNGIDDDCDGLVDEDNTSLPAGSIAVRCPDTMECQNGACACKPEHLCGADCVDVSSDTANCGACGSSCGTNGVSTATWRCVSGSCECIGAVCGTVCTDLQSDNKNCGACGNDCAATDPDSWCRSGVCGRHCFATTLTCASNQVCKYSGASFSCISDPCPGQTLSCSAPCYGNRVCGPSCFLNGRATLVCQ